MLSKSEYKSALDCPKKLWLSRHEPGAKAAPSVTAQNRMKNGREVGVLAKGRFPGGVTVPVWELTNEEAAARTAELMDKGLPAIFEATFIHDDCIARVDVLQRERDQWRIVEVKATSKYKKPDHLPDVAFQASIFTRLGHQLSGVSLMHLNSDYDWEGGAWDLYKLFEIEDVTDDVEKVLSNIPGTARGLITMAAERAYPPADGVSPYYDPVIHAACKNCEFAQHCILRVPADHIYYLGLHHSKTKRLLAEGIFRIGDVPDDFAMSATEQLRFEAFRSGEPAIASDLAERLADIRYPAHLIDFETLRPDLPLFAGHPPFLLLPFQWSCHTLDATPDCSTSSQDRGHAEFLHQDRSDPRKAFVESLLDKLESGGSVLHYHGFEKNVIKEMAQDGVPGAGRLEAMFDRFIDLRKILEDCYADAGFLGKTSIKNVLPVVAPGLSYKGLAIQNGDQAQIEYAQALAGELSNEDAQIVYRNLLEYCKLDTWAMVEILKVLTQAASTLTVSV